MKTIKREILKTRNGVAVMIAFIISLTLAGCTKDELLQPSASLTMNQSPNMRSVVSAYPMIIIDHASGFRGMGPDYRVTVFSDGNVLFEGRKNVSLLGRTTFKIDEAELGYLRTLFISENFFGIDDDIQMIPDAPEIFTTFNSGEMIKSLHDYNNGDPQVKMLVDIRTKVEVKLQISKFVYGRSTVTSEVSPIAD